MLLHADQAAEPCTIRASNRALVCPTTTKKGAPEVRVAFLGTRGIPARYGGFETAVEEIGGRLVDRGHEVIVYTRRDHGTRDADADNTRGMRRIVLPCVRRASLETLTHTFLASIHSSLVSQPDAVVLFNCGNAPLIPILKARGIPCAVHVDGLEWKRAKWQRGLGLGAKYYRRAEMVAARRADVVIADAVGISAYYQSEYGRESTVIPYGALVLHPDLEGLSSLDVTAGGYHLVVARMEPENNVHTIVQGFELAHGRLPLVVVGSTPYSSAYERSVRNAASDRVRFLGAVWDQNLLNQLYAGAASYLHGHSVGGTNPSLLRAMGCGAPVTAFDVNFNREVLRASGRYFSSTADLVECIRHDETYPELARLRGEEGRARAALHYRWEDVATMYEEMLLTLSKMRA